MIVEVAKEADLLGVAKVHRECFPEYFISTFGEHLIEEYYRCFLKEDNLFVIAKEGESIIGFCMGYRYGSTARSIFLKENRIKLGIRMLQQCLKCNKLVISKCWNYFLGIFDKKIGTNNSNKLAEGDLLSICVLPNCEGKGISRALLEAFEIVLSKKQINDYVLSVYKTNKRAVHFYEKMGLKIVAETENEYKMYKIIEVANYK